MNNMQKVANKIINDADEFFLSDDTQHRECCVRECGESFNIDLDMRTIDFLIDFIEWYMNRYRNDEKYVAFELLNESCLDMSSEEFFNLSKERYRQENQISRIARGIQS